MDASKQISLFDPRQQNAVDRKLSETKYRGQTNAPFSSGVQHEASSDDVADADVPQRQPTIVMYSGQRAASHPSLVKRVSHIFNESFGYRPDGRPYRLGHKSVTERLMNTDYLFIEGDESSSVGYLFGKEIPSSFGRVAWVESMAVLPLYRRQGTATALVTRFFLATKGAFFFGCATPNPIAAYVVLSVVRGRFYIGPSSAPPTLYRMLKEIRRHCFDLRGCSIDQEHFRIETGFSPLSRSDQREWSPREPQDRPPWWSAIEHLPNEYEALLVIQCAPPSLSADR